MNTKEDDKMLYDEKIVEFSQMNSYLQKLLIPAFKELAKKGFIYIKSGSAGVILKKKGKKEIVKIVFKKGECDTIQGLPSIENAPYLSPSEYKCEKVNESFIKEKWNELYEMEFLDPSPHYYLITMPYMGVDFLDYLWNFSYSHFKKIWASYEKVKPEIPHFMTIKKYKRISHALYKLFNALQRMMFKEGFIHGDIKLNNIIYDEARGTMTLIDFDQSKLVPLPVVGEEADNDNRNFIKLVLLRFLYYAIGNHAIFESMKDLIHEIESPLYKFDPVKMMNKWYSRTQLLSTSLKQTPTEAGMFDEKNGVIRKTFLDKKIHNLKTIMLPLLTDTEKLHSYLTKQQITEKDDVSYVLRVLKTLSSKGWLSSRSRSLSNHRLSLKTKIHRKTRSLSNQTV